MSALAPISPKLGKLIALLSSDKDGEIVAAVRAIGRVLKDAGADWHDLANAVSRPLPPATVNYRDAPQRPPARAYGGAPTWGRLTREQKLHWLDRLPDADWLSPWEHEFTASIRAQLQGWCPRDVSPKQRAILDRMLAKSWERGLAP